MALMALLGTSCRNNGERSEANGEGKAPITKPQITIEGGRLTPEGLWAMGRIGSVKSDIETGLLAYTVSYYSVAENRKLAKLIVDLKLPFDQLIDEANYAWVHVSHKKNGGNRGQILRMRGGKYTVIKADQL